MERDLEIGLPSANKEDRDSTAMKRIFYAVVLAAACSAAHADIVYDTDISFLVPFDGVGISTATISIVGTITTDGAFGPLQPADILAWNLTVNTPTSQTLIESPAGGVRLTGDALTANPDVLHFNYGYSGSFVIQFGTAAIDFESEIPLSDFGSLTVTDGHGEYSIDTGDNQFTVIGGAETAAVPLPASAWLMLSGIGAIGAFTRKRKTT
jgi:hypothetical protein